MQALRRAEAIDPVFMLDEIDKVGADWRGDPSSALLEVLDPEQNEISAITTWTCRSPWAVMFTTPPHARQHPAGAGATQEVIQLPGYSDDEKFASLRASWCASS